MKASEAREIANSRNNTLYEVELKRIKDQIKASAEGGNYRVNYMNIFLTPEITKTLQLENYTLQFAINGSLESISW